MPFEKKFDDIYAFGIKQTCAEINAYCERVDEQIFSERILDRIYNQISKADIVIADMTDRNANVFYEVGYAHGIGKNVILLTQNADDIPFDLKHFPHIIYNGEIKKLSSLIKAKLDWFLNEASLEEIENSDFGIEFLIDGEKLEENKVITLNVPAMRILMEEHHNVKIDIRNSSNKIYKSEFKLGLEIDSKDSEYFFRSNHIKPSKSRVLYELGKFSEIYPNDYTSTNFMVKILKTDTAKPASVKVILKIFTKMELKEINFTLKIPTELKPVRPTW